MDVEVMWFGQIAAIYAYQVSGAVIKVLFKIFWYEIEKGESSLHPAKYIKPGMYDFQPPAVIAGHVLVVPDGETDLFFVQPHFCRYYSRYFIK